ncbi:GNAT family N-acetyltransferase [Sulfidibacter corallicola]
MNAMPIRMMNEHDALIHWLLQHGARFPDQRVVEFAPGNRGVIAAKPFSRGNEALFIPRQVMMCRDTADASDIGRAIHRSRVSLISGQCVLAAFLLQEMENPRSFWLPYLRTLPADFDDCPIFFNDRLLTCLKGSYCLDMVHERRRIIETDYRSLCEAVPGFSRHALSAFTWAMTVVNTRCFGVPGEEDDCIPALVPLLDMYNHRQGYDCKRHFASAENGFVLQLNHDLAAGSELCVTYGAKSNGRFFVNYGFLDRASDRRDARIKLVPDPRDPTIKLRLAHWKGADSKDFIVSTDSWDSMETCLTELRMVVSATLDQSVYQSDREGKPRSLKHEILSLHLLVQHVDTALAQFPGSVEEDRALLDGTKKPIRPDARFLSVVRMRAYEKETLQLVHDFAEAALAVLCLPRKEMMAELRRLAAEDHQTQTPWLQGWCHQILAVFSLKYAWLERTDTAEPETASQDDARLNVVPANPSLWQKMHQLELPPAQRRYVPRPEELLREQVFSDGIRPQTVVIRMGEEPVGMFCYTLEETGAAGFFGFQVDQQYQGRGVGRWALRAFLRGILHFPNVNCVRLNVHKKNVDATCFYLREGFKLMAPIPESAAHLWDLIIDREDIEARFASPTPTPVS